MVGWVWSTSSLAYNGGLRVEYFASSLKWWVECGVLRLQLKMVGWMCSTSPLPENGGLSTIVQYFAFSFYWWFDSEVFRIRQKSQIPSATGVQRKRRWAGKKKKKKKILSFLPYVELISEVAMRHELCLLTLRKWPKLSRPSASGHFSASPAWSTRPVPICRARSTTVWVYRNLF